VSVRPSAFLQGFELRDQIVNGARIRFAVAGKGPAILLLHGHPQTHVVWRKVAPDLVRAGFTVVAPDLRGYGDSEKVVSDALHAPYSKREMAKDQVGLMRALGHDRFHVVGHDRGGRVAHRMALDHPQAVAKIVVLDIAPTLTMYACTDQTFATRYFWWFFLIQPAGLPERMIGADPEFFLRHHIAGQSRTEGAICEDVLAEYLRCYREPDTVHAICEDYRAAASIDLDHDRADSHKRIEAPLLALWGAKGVVGELYDVLETWRDKARDVQGTALPCGHAIPEEVPAELTQAMLDFFGV
jgi:haloacetate dehalogenase